MMIHMQDDDEEEEAAEAAEEFCRDPKRTNLSKHKKHKRER